MTSFRRHLVYVLHDGSANTTRRITSLLQGLRADPYALETAWLSFICLAGKAKQVVPLKEIELIGEFCFPEAEAGAPDLDGALAVFEFDVNANLRKTTATTKGDWRPILVIVLYETPQGEISRGLDSIKRIKCGVKIAFLGNNVSALTRARLMDGGFELYDITEGVVQPGESGLHGHFWDEVVCGKITMGHAAPAPMYGLPPPPVLLDLKVIPGASSSDAVASVFSDVAERRSGEVAGNSCGEIFPDKFFDLTADGRLTRSGLLGCFMLCMGLLSVAFCINMFSVVFSAVVATIALLALSFGFVRRTHDVGLSGWFLLIPLLNLWLLVAPGQLEDNKFGRNPRSPTKH